MFKSLFLIGITVFAMFAYGTRHSSELNAAARRKVVSSGMALADFSPDSLRDEIARGSFTAANMIREWQE